MDNTTPQPPASPEPPYYGPPAYYAPAPAPRHRGSRWRWGLAGGIAGGLIAAAVAVPVTLQLADQGSTSSAASSPSAGSGLLPGNLPNTLPGGSDGSGDTGGSDGSGGFGTVPGADTQASGTAATEAQSKGVLLVESTLTNGAGAGTAMVLDSSGLALTNYHVVENSTHAPGHRRLDRRDVRRHRGRLRPEVRRGADPAGRRLRPGHRHPRQGRHRRR